MANRRSVRFAPPARQEGVVLLISLIVLVAMTLAGVALMRSVDTAVGVAGNVAFKQSAVQVADTGTQQASVWLGNNSTGTTLQNDNAALGYFSARPGSEPNWYDINSWGQSVVLNGGTPDASGNVVRYVVHRMCTESNTPYNGSNGVANNQCALYFPLSTAAQGGSMQVGAAQFLGTPMIYYRVTTRVDGPRNTVSVIQTSVLVSI
jgi:type IV pilus assembly protein PilX